MSISPLTHSANESALPFDDLETVYTLLALAIDRAGPGREVFALSRLALLLAHELGDITRIERAIHDAFDEDMLTTVG